MNTDTDNDAAIVAAAAAANRGGADGSDVARSDGAGTGSVEEHATRESAKPPHGQEEEEGAYPRRRVRLLEREVSRLRETVERLTRERAEWTAEGPNSDSEGQRADHLYEGDERKIPRGPNGNDYGSATPATPATPVSVSSSSSGRRADNIAAAVVRQLEVYPSGVFSVDVVSSPLSFLATVL